MPTYYGSNNHLEDIRTLMVTNVTALIAAMDTAVTDPAIDYVYSTHKGTAALQFNSVSIGVSSADITPQAQSASPSGITQNALYQINLRVMTGYRNTYHDEIKTGRLCQSLMNWLNENRSLGSQWHIVGDMAVDLRSEFDDTQTIGGTVTLVAQRWQSHTAA